jgi:VWFA-related protein
LRGTKEHAVGRLSKFCILSILALGFCGSLCPEAEAQALTTPGIVAPDVASPSVPSDFVFQKRVDEVNLLFTVVDRKGRFVSDLKLDDLQLRDNKQPPDKVHSFQQESDLPLRVALVVDISGSVTARFKYEQGSAVEFFRKILRPQMDKALVVGFNQKVHLEQDLTNDTIALKKAVMRLKPDGETAIFDAILFAADKLRRDPDPGTRKIIILISDGENNGSKSIMNDAEQAALRAEAPIFSLSTNTFRDNDYTRGEATLELLSRYTGGELLRAHDRADVARAFKQVEQALRSQYVLSYKPADFAPDGRYRQVALSAHNPNTKVECRHGYYAPKN